MKLLAWLIVAVFAVASVNAYWCYQETANVSTACGGLATGAYSSVVNEWPMPVYAYLYINYSKPQLVFNTSLWQIKYGSNNASPANITIPNNCFSQTVLMFRIYSQNSPAGNYTALGECYNGSSWVVVAPLKYIPDDTFLVSSSIDVWYDGDWSTASKKWAAFNGFAYSFNAGSANITGIFEEAMWWDIYSSLNASFYDEETNAPIAQAFNVLAIGPAGLAFNQSVSGVFNISNLTAGDWEFRYWAKENYTTVRSYFLTLASSSNQVVRLYAINDSVSSYFVASVIDQYGAICANCTLSLLRGQFEGGAYVSYVVEMAKTDGTGAAVLRLHPNNVYYKFFITSNSQGSLTTTYSKITSSSQTFQVSKSVPGGLFTLFTQPAQNVSFNAATNTFSLNWLDTTNTITGGCLVVKKTSQFGVVSVVANSCAVGSTGSVIYTVVDVNGTSYQANGNISTASDSYVLSSQVDYRTTYAVFGLAGVFFATILFVFAIFLAAPSAPTVVIVGIVGVMVVALIGLIVSSWMALAGVAVIGIITVFLMNRGN